MSDEDEIFFEDGHPVRHLIEIEVPAETLHLLEDLERTDDARASEVFIRALEVYAAQRESFEHRYEPAAEVLSFAARLRSKWSGPSERGPNDAEVASRWLAWHRAVLAER